MVSMNVDMPPAPTVQRSADIFTSTRHTYTYVYQNNHTIDNIKPPSRKIAHALAMYPHTTAVGRTESVGVLAKDRVYAQ